MTKLNTTTIPSVLKLSDDIEYVNTTRLINVVNNVKITKFDNFTDLINVTKTPVTVSASVTTDSKTIIIANVENNTETSKSIPGVGKTTESTENITTTSNARNVPIDSTKNITQTLSIPNATTDYKVIIVNVENKTETFKATPNNTTTTTESIKNNSQIIKRFKVNTTIDLPIVKKIHTRLPEKLDLNKIVFDRETPNNTSTTTESTKNNSQTLKIRLSETLDSDTQSLSIATDVDSANITGTYD